MYASDISTSLLLDICVCLFVCFVLSCFCFVLFVCLLACLVVCLFVCFCLLDMTVTLHSTAQYTESTALPNYGLAQVALGTQLTL